MKPTHPAGLPMMLGNMRHLGVQNLVAYYLNDGFSAQVRFICARTDDEIETLNDFYASQVKQRSSAEKMFGL